MRVIIYQIVAELDKERMSFQDSRYFETLGYEGIPAQFYEAVYDGDLEVESAENVFYIFNMEHPDGYKGRSLSVSDVVEFRYSDTSSDYFYCEHIGFSHIEFDRSKAMLPISNHTREILEVIKCGWFQLCFVGENGFTAIPCEKVVLTNCKYSQSQLGYEIKYWPVGYDKVMMKEFLDRPRILLVYNGFLGFPKQLGRDFDSITEWCCNNHIQHEFI